MIMSKKDKEITRLKKELSNSYKRIDSLTRDYEGKNSMCNIALMDLEERYINLKKKYNKTKNAEQIQG